MAWWDKLGEGKSVDKATSALPQATTKNLFSATGRVIIHTIVGEVTTIIGAVANSTKLEHVPTGGAAIDLCAAGTDLNGDAVGNYYGITGIPVDGMLKGLGRIPSPVQGTILAAGIIRVNCAGSDGGTGRVKWTVRFTPLDDGADIVAL